MTKADITIPREAIEAHAKALLTHETWGQRSWNDLSDVEREERREGSETACLAMIKAWPGMKLKHLSSWVMDGPNLPYVEEVASIILPLPQESGE